MRPGGLLIEEVAEAKIRVAFAFVAMTVQAIDTEPIERSCGGRFLAIGRRGHPAAPKTQGDDRHHQLSGQMNRSEHARGWWRGWTSVRPGGSHPSSLSLKRSESKLGPARLRPLVVCQGLKFGLPS